MTELVDVVVLGGGVSGLAAAFRAQQLGARTVVLEADGDVGGVMRTDHREGFLVEHGPTSMAMTPVAEQLLRDLGLQDDVVSPPASARRRYVVRNGTMHALPSSPLTFVRTPLLSARGKLRMIVEPFVARRTAQHDESLEALVRRRLGQDVLDYIVDPFVSGMCGGDPSQLSAKYTLRILRDLEREHGSILGGMIRRARRGGARPAPIRSLRGGMHQLPAALHQRIDQAYRRSGPTGDGDAGGVRCGAKVTRIRRRECTWEVEYSAGHEIRKTQAHAIVCALPLHALSAVQWPTEWQAPLATMATVTYAPIATVALGFHRDQVAHAVDGFGVLVPSVERQAILGALFNSTMFPKRSPDAHHLITVFVGGARTRELPDAGRCVHDAMTTLTPLLGLTGVPVMTSTTRWPQGIPQLMVNHERVLAAAREIEDTMPRAFFTGSALSGVAIGDCLAHGLAIGDRAASDLSV